MLVVELNVAGYRFNARLLDRSRAALCAMRFNPRTVQWWIPQVRDARAA